MYIHFDKKKLEEQSTAMRAKGPILHEAVLPDQKAKERYLAKLTALKMRWAPEAPKDPKAPEGPKAPELRDSIETRIIYPLLHPCISPLAQAVIADNLTYFEEHYKPTSLQPKKTEAETEVKAQLEAESKRDDLELKTKEVMPKPNMPSRTHFLKVACLCGSKKIAEHLMRDLQIDFSTEGYEELREYVLSLPLEENREWAIEIAKKTPNKMNGMTGENGENRESSKKGQDSQQQDSKKGSPPKTR